MTTLTTLKVKLTQPARTRETHITLPAGAIGLVLDYHRDKAGSFWMIDFGLLSVIRLPIDSPFVELVNGGER